MPEVNGYTIETKTEPTFTFVGVTTGSSSINKVFPMWMRVLGREDVKLTGVDHAIHDEPENYRKTVAQFKYDPQSLGGLVTTHKIDLLEATRDMFDELHSSAQLTGEVSSISKKDGKLVGHAMDPITAGISLDAILGEGYFERTGGHVLCYGAGGSGKAISLHLIEKVNKADRPTKMVVTNRSLGRLQKLEAMVKGLGTDIEFEFIQNQDPKVNDEILGRMPPHTVVINATGMGKDTPGSPITDDGVFPEHAVSWEINYRGALDFWHQSMAQVESRGVIVEDGWLYFLHGWTQVIKNVLDIDLTDDLFQKLADEVAHMRPKLEYVPRK